MIKNIIELLNAKEHFGLSERVEIAKGKYQLPNTWKDVWYKIKRHSKQSSWQTKQ
jgi:hypothetical protein